MDRPLVLASVWQWRDDALVAWLASRSVGGDEETDEAEASSRDDAVEDALNEGFQAMDLVFDELLASSRQGVGQALPDVF